MAFFLASQVSPVHVRLLKQGSCPRISGGTCLRKCSSDADCVDVLKCCSNGCGLECVPPTNIPSPLFIGPVQSQHTLTRIGHCPSYEISDKCNNKICTNDNDCEKFEKCCESNCGQTCRQPDQTTNCIHLYFAIKRLLVNNLEFYLPECDTDGNFKKIQCDRDFCWCVEQNIGNEILGTKKLRGFGPPDCSGITHCPVIQCNNFCPFGVMTDYNGCPLTKCECKNLCAGIRCRNNFDICQLIESNCINPPCIPIPSCLLNPCPNGMPSTLANGATALCLNSQQCSSNYWCHQIGYNGFGFCCPLPKARLNNGKCKKQLITALQNCESTCKIDEDCASKNKCCFDGCGLKCTAVHYQQNDSVADKSATAISVENNSKSKSRISILLAAAHNAIGCIGSTGYKTKMLPSLSVLSI
ncbi:unnamed protein product [Dracunculus medinensis]|uniref:WAP domain-containing protein n=1 Tax=Dracunculus medinensis TaxID=318479 RepID=A0A3P7T537_DRAME|nr:unnamed protein product [Dracunculus medinensis]